MPIAKVRIKSNSIPEMSETLNLCMKKQSVWSVFISGVVWAISRIALSVSFSMEFSMFVGKDGPRGGWGDCHFKVL